MRVILVRHPPPDIAAGICYGRLDIALTQAATAELPRRATDPILLGVTRIWTSPARRCHELASTIARHLTVQLLIDTRLLELDFGEWEGRTWNDVPRAALDQWAASPATFAPPKGESGAALIKRVSGFFADLGQWRQSCVIVSHGGPLKILSALLRGQPVDLLAAPPPVGSVTVIEVA